MPALSYDITLFPRDLNSTISTAESFKHWDTCMANSTCKPVAIVLIIIGIIFFFLLVAGIVNCFCGAVSCVGACLDNIFCCCRRRRSQNIANKQGFVPLAEPQYIRQAAPVYVPQQAYGGHRYEDPYKVEK